MSELVIKKQIIEKCKEILLEQMKVHEIAMEEAQAEANSHKGAMESRYDTFKEEAQEKKNSHAKQHSQLSDLFEKIASIDLRIHNSVKFGSVVITDKKNFFTLSYLSSDPITVNDLQYYTISLISPIGRLLNGKKSGDQINFNNNKFTIKSIF